MVPPSGLSGTIAQTTWEAEPQAVPPSDMAPSDRMSHPISQIQSYLGLNWPLIELVRFLSKLTQIKVITMIVKAKTIYDTRNLSCPTRQLFDRTLSELSENSHQSSDELLVNSWWTFDELLMNFQRAFTTSSNPLVYHNWFIRFDAQSLTPTHHWILH